MRSSSYLWAFPLMPNTGMHIQPWMRRCFSKSFPGPVQKKSDFHGRMKWSFRGWMRQRTFRKSWISGHSLMVRRSRCITGNAPFHWRMTFSGDLWLLSGRCILIQEKQQFLKTHTIHHGIISAAARGTAVPLTISLPPEVPGVVP